MAVLKEVKKSYMDDMALQNVIHYIVYPGHALDNEVLGGAVYPEDAVAQMRLVRQCYHKELGRQVRHFVLAFAPTDGITEDTVQLLQRGITEYYGQRYQCVSAIHRNTENIHIHIAINTVSYQDGRMYCEGYQGLYDLIHYVQTICSNLKVQLAFE